MRGQRRECAWSTKKTTIARMYHRLWGVASKILLKGLKQSVVPIATQALQPWSQKRRPVVLDATRPSFNPKQTRSRSPSEAARMRSPTINLKARRVSNLKFRQRNRWPWKNQRRRLGRRILTGRAACCRTSRSLKRSKTPRNSAISHRIDRPIGKALQSKRQRRARLTLKSAAPWVVLIVIRRKTCIPKVSNWFRSNLRWTHAQCRASLLRVQLSVSKTKRASRSLTMTLSQMRASRLSHR